MPIQKLKGHSNLPQKILPKAELELVLIRFASYMIENQKETPQEKPKSTPKVIVIVAHSTSFSTRPKTTGSKWWNGA